MIFNLILQVQNGEQAKDYDKLLLSRPNDSMLWIEFMSEHLNSGDIERARAVAEQALKTISFRSDLLEDDDDDDDVL